MANDYQITKAPGYSQLPDCATSGLQYGIEYSGYSLCQSNDAPSVYISCLCNSQFDAIETIIAVYIEYLFEYCNTALTNPVDSVLTAYCSMNAQGELFGASAVSTSGLSSF